MDGFKNSTKTQYSMGGSCYAKGGSVKGAAKVAKVMGEFKSGDLHSGSKKGPKVTNPKQAIAISLSEARKAGAKMPVKKANGGLMNDRTVDESGEDAVMPTRAELAADKARRAAAARDRQQNGSLEVQREQLKAMARGPAPKAKAKPTYTDVPMIDNAINSVRSRLGLKKGGPVKKARGGAMGPSDSGAASSSNASPYAYSQPTDRAAPSYGGSSDAGMRVSPTVVSQGQSTLGNLVGARAPSAPGLTIGFGAGSTNSTMASGQGPAEFRAKGSGGKEQLKAKGGLAAMPRGKKC